jgi:hypothetical protein
MRWSELQPHKSIVDALKHAGPRPNEDVQNDKAQNDKKNWSARFANGCAIAIAQEFRQHEELKGKTVKPLSHADGVEPLTPLGAGSEKKIDVTIADAVLGLELGVSLKGMNFIDNKGRNYDKNLTGRAYEMGDELRVVHEHLPHAFMVGIFFLPIAACSDKKSERSASAFANTVVTLRSRTGRLDPALAAHASRCDAAYVALYAHTEEGGFHKGIVRFFNVRSKPPKRGRPRIETTLSLAQMVDQVVLAATHRTNVEWAEPEEDQADPEAGEKARLGI